MQDGNVDVMENAERALRNIAGCGLGHSAKALLNLIRYTESLEKNQQKLIKSILKLQRTNKALEKITRRMYIIMNDGQKDIVDVWLEGKNDST